MGQVLDTSMTALRLIGKKEVCHLTGLAPSTIDRLEDQGHFPKRIPITGGRVGWPLDKVLEWIKKRIDERKPIILIPDEDWKAMKARSWRDPITTQLELTSPDSGLVGLAAPRGYAHHRSTVCIGV
jgi:predicted DNA-binding transcriptional regulator AlpA